MRFGPHLFLRCGLFIPGADRAGWLSCRMRGAAVAPVVCRAYGSFAGTLAWRALRGYDAYLETTGGTMHIALDKL